MKKSILLVIVCGLLTISFESYAALILIKPDQQQTLSYGLSNQPSVKQYQKLPGKKTSLFEKINYLLLKHHLKKNHTDNNGFSAGGFVLGFLLGPVGVGIAYLASKNKRFRKGAVTGFVFLIGAGILSALIFVTLAGQY